MTYTDFEGVTQQRQMVTSGIMSLLKEILEWVNSMEGQVNSLATERRYCGAIGLRIYQNIRTVKIATYRSDVKARAFIGMTFAIATY